MREPRQLLVVVALGVAALLAAPQRDQPATGAPSRKLPVANTPGNPQAGKLLFEGKGDCRRCHTVDGQGGVLGPDLSSIGLLRSPERLRLSLLDPDDEIDLPYITFVAVTPQGQEFRGLRLNEDDLSIQLRDGQNNLKSFVKSGLQELRREMVSLMPSYAGKLSAAEVTDLVGYLLTLTKPLPPAKVDDDDDDKL